MSWIVINPKKKLNTWSNTLKILILGVSVAVFFPIVYFLIYPIIGALWSLVIYFVYLFINAFLVRVWSYKKFGKEEHE